MLNVEKNTNKIHRLGANKIDDIQYRYIAFKLAENSLKTIITNIYN